MKLIFKTTVHIAANAAAIWAASNLIHGFDFHGPLIGLLLAGAVLGIINSFIKPIVKLITLPVIFLTLGLFSIVINVAMLVLAANLVPGLVIHGFWAAFWGVIVISIVNNIILALTPNN